MNIMNSIYIYMTDGTIDTWKPSEFTEYDIRKDLFFILANNQAVGIYNLSEVQKIIVK